jgi:hypothetical protein
MLKSKFLTNTHAISNVFYKAMLTTSIQLCS